VCYISVMPPRQSNLQTPSKGSVNHDGAHDHGNGNDHGDGLRHNRKRYRHEHDDDDEVGLEAGVRESNGVAHHTHLTHSLGIYTVEKIVAQRHTGIADPPRAVWM
jgi:hypothetical protein